MKTYEALIPLILLGLTLLLVIGGSMTVNAEESETSNEELNAKLDRILRQVEDNRERINETSKFSTDNAETISVIERHLEKQSEELESKTIYKSKDPYWNINSPEEDVDWDHRGDTVRIDDIDKCLRVEGGSMEPRVHDGETVCYKEVDEDNVAGRVQPGDDVVAEREENIPLVHTAVAVYPSREKVYLQGVSQESEKRQVFNFSEVIGVRQVTIVGE